MQEFLVVLACLSNKGCSETANAYYQAHPEIKQMVKRQEERVKEYVGPVVVTYASPMFFVAAGGSGNFKLYGDFSLKVDNYKEATLIFSKGF